MDSDLESSASEASESPPTRVNVYEIVVTPTRNPHDICECQGHPYEIPRSDDWTPQLRASFSSLERAREYIRRQTLRHPKTTGDLCKWTALATSPDERRHIIDAYCFDDDRYLARRRFFIGPPPMRAIRAALRQDGVLRRRY